MGLRAIKTQNLLPPLAHAMLPIPTFFWTRASAPRWFLRKAQLAWEHINQYLSIRLATTPSVISGSHCLSLESDM